MNKKSAEEYITNFNEKNQVDTYVEYGYMCSKLATLAQAYLVADRENLSTLEKANLPTICTLLQTASRLFTECDGYYADDIIERAVNATIDNLL